MAVSHEAKWRWVPVGVAIIGVISIVGAIVALTGASSKARDAGAPTSAGALVVATEPAPLAHSLERAPHVESQIAVYGVQGSVRGAPSTPPPELTPVAANAFRRPVARYLAYSG